MKLRQLKRNHLHLPALILSCLVFGFIHPGCLEAEVFIRVNQAGYHPQEAKRVVFQSSGRLWSKSFSVETTGGKLVLKGRLGKDMGRFLGSRHTHIAELAGLDQPGEYVVRYGEVISAPFRVAGDLPYAIPDSLLAFFRVQRCGDTTPAMHRPCHLRDVVKVIGPRGESGPVDATGGWHDAGDYIKFTLTTAHAAYLLLLTYETWPEVIGDANGNGLSDLLDEAKVGLDWLMKMHPSPGILLTQVQGPEDHDVGWRLPENDPLADKRPAYSRPSRTVCGSAAATFALAGRIFTGAGSVRYGEQCLRHALQLDSLASTGIPDCSTGPDSMYHDRDPADNIALAATELYFATGKHRYLERAMNFSENAAPVHWISWGDVGGLVHARLAGIHDYSRTMLEKSLAWYDSVAAGNAFGYPLDRFPWGSAAAQAGIGGLALLHAEATGSQQFLPLAEKQRDFLLGVNPHGISMITGCGRTHPLNPHNQVALLENTNLPGALVGGYIATDVFLATGIELALPDRFKRFQSKQAVYYDDHNDYLSNEPTISGNAQAMLLFAGFDGR